MSEKKCSKCSAPFLCCNEEPGCWCEDVNLTSETLIRLRTEYSNCLCEKCLRQEESGQII
ncbi:hypothetical protein CH373_13110 [Leptospira perolatii]|uniref:Cysteine-rich CWC n=1 Tax=Leptospira perolatii TaxID=2023191 RepID=A0A2M9ZKQ7_9LEPT|nr:hypothetical protein CH360_08575 [Leptospira perolatii]PJZ72645.1 hypothetical protein CH373_13110 [Leptospira perolatii]